MGLSDVERVKYEQVWARPEYRKISPGEMLCTQAWDALGCLPGESLNDYGAGTGRATLWFQSRGLSVLSVDHVSGALEVCVPHVECCLWEMEMVRSSDWGLCCDVMEHIPMEKIRDVLSGIAHRTLRGVFFSVATRPDVMGPRLIGEPLHLSVLRAEEWTGLVSEFFSSVRVLFSSERQVVMTAWRS